MIKADQFDYDSDELRVQSIQNMDLTIRDLDMYVKDEGLDIRAGALSIVERALCERLTLELAKGVVLPQKLLEAKLIYNCRAAIEDAEKGKREGIIVAKRLAETLKSGDQGMYAYCNSKAEFFTQVTEEMDVANFGLNSTTATKDLHISLMNQSFSWTKMRDEYYIHGKPLPTVQQTSNEST